MQHIHTYIYDIIHAKHYNNIDATREVLQWIPYGFLWIPLLGNVCSSYAFLWIPMDTYGFLWINKDSHGIPYGFLWIP
jgi:hypothetical protein